MNRRIDSSIKSKIKKLENGKKTKGQDGKLILVTAMVLQMHAYVSSVQFSSVAQSCPTLRLHELQHARPPCPSPTPGSRVEGRKVFRERGG